MSTTRTALAALAATLAAAAASATIGLAAMPAHATPDAWQPATRTVAPATPPTMTATQVEGWRLYRSEISPNDGCWLDFTSSFLGLDYADAYANTPLRLAPYADACN